MLSFGAVAAHIWLAHIFIFRISTAPTTEDGKFIFHREVTTLAAPPGDVPYPPGYSPQSCSKAGPEGNLWNDPADGDSRSVVEVSTFSDNRSNETDAERIESRQVANNARTPLCQPQAWESFKGASGIIRPKAITVVGNLGKYFLSWEVDGAVIITFYTKLAGGNWEKRTIERGTVKGSALDLEPLDGIDQIAFEFSLQPNDHGGQTGTFLVTKIDA